MKKKLCAVCTAAALLVQITALAAEPQKEEVVYVTLDSAGETQRMIVVNSFKTNGNKKITDYGSYKKIKNLSSTEKPDTSGGKVVFNTGGADEFRYQGEVESGELPWSLRIGYKLNSRPVKGEEMVGKSGSAEITLEVKSNPASDSYYRDNYIAQITMTLDTNKCGNIVCDDAIAADVGSNRQLTFMTLPGRSKTFKITFDAKNFEMDGLTIAMLKLSDGILGNTVDNAAVTVSGVTSGISALIDGSGQLKNGAEDLVSAISLLNTGSQSIKNSFPALNAGLSSLDSGAAELSGGLQTLYSASNRIRSGLFELDSKSADIANGISAVEGGLEEMTKNKQTIQSGLNKLKQSKTSVKTLTESGGKLIDGYEQIYGGISEMADKKGEIQAGLDTLHTSGTDISAMSAGLGSLSDGMDSIYSAMSQQLQLIDLLMAKAQGNAEMLQYLSMIKAIASGVQSGASSASGGIAELKDGADKAQTGINTLYTAADTFGNAALAMCTGAETMKSGMGTLNAGLSEYCKGVGSASELYSSAETFGNAALKLTNGAQKLYSGVKTLSNGFDSYSAGVGELASGCIAVDNGIYSANQGAAALYSGASSAASNSDTLYSVVTELSDNIDKLDNSASSLPSGIDRLTAGTSRLFDGISSVDIAAMISDGSSAEAISFAAPYVSKPEKVQFLVKTPNLHIKENKNTEEQEEKKGFFRKLLDLFI